jgi:hypothetical protein
MFAASKTDSVSGGPPDGQFNYVTMLLHGDGTNGAQNNTFLDSSTNNFTITRNGNTTQGSFSPYGSNWSNYFSSDYIYTTSSIGSYASDFTIESWVNAEASGTVPWCLGNAATTSGIRVSLLTTALRIITNNALLASFTTSAWTVGTWNHIAIVRSSGVITFYLNGASVGTVSHSATLSGSFVLGGLDNGSINNGGVQYLSNVRVTNTAVYTGNFTPSTTPLTAITGTALLTCQSNRFLDTSSNAYALTIVGSTSSVQRFNPFGTSTAYSTSVIGGSGYFDGNGDYLSLADNAALTFGTGNYSVEFWAYRTTATQMAVMMFKNNSFVVSINTSGGLYVYDGDVIDGGSAPTFSWTHYAAVRTSGNLVLYVNGVSVYSAANTANWTNGATLRIGVSNNVNDYVNGYISGLRVANTSLYSAAFTPPTSPVTAVSGTQLLLSNTNGAIFDNAMMNDLETVGNAQISTSVKKYGTGSLKFDGTGDYLKHWKATNITLDTGAFTFEFWFQTSSSTQYATFFSNESGGGGFTILINSSAGNGVIQIYNGGSGLIHASSAGGYKNGVWHHLALSRDSSGSRFFINGTQQGATNSGQASAVFDGGDWIIGNNLSFSGRDYNGYIDDFRITKGFARYTANFTAPTSAFSDTGPY